MPRTKAMTTRARELAKELNPEQIKQLAELLSQEAEKPRIDQKQYQRLQREVRSAYVRLTNAEEQLSTLLTEAGKTNDEINDEINELRRTAERARVSAPTDKPGRGRRKATAE